MKTLASLLLMTALTATGILPCSAAGHPLSSKFDGPSRQHILFGQEPGARSSALHSGFVSFGPGYEAELPEELYSGFRRMNDGIAIVRGTLAQFEAIAALPQVSAIRLSRPGTATNDISARETGAAAANSAPGIDGEVYTGKGVIAGIFDNGFDFQNPSFRRSDGHSRVLRYFSTGPDATEYSQQAVIDALTTDNSEEMHGSHVLGTMAGYYPGGQYNGMATGADIVVSSGELIDDYIAEGVSKIAAFARDEGKPCVINLSISDFLGPRDGTDLFARSLQAATYDSGDAILCIAAGNDGETGHSVTATLTEEQTEACTLIYHWDPEKVFEGGMAVWSGDSRDISMSLALYDTKKTEPLVTFPVEANPDETFLINSYDYSEEIPEGLEALSHEIFDKAFTNSTLSAHYDTNASTNGRPSFYVYYSLHINPETNSDIGIMPAVIIKGAAGQRIDINMAGENCILRGFARDGWHNGSQNMSISSMACTVGAVSAGAYVTRPTFDNIDGKTISTGDFEEGQYAPWSSLGTTVDGRQLPVTAAPGCMIISVASTPYVESHPDYEHVTGSKAGTDRTDYWALEYGTSMATPAVAGGIALWLEADPSLTADEVHDIIYATARKDRFTATRPLRFGAGKFDAEAGLREVLRRKASLIGPSAVVPGDMTVRRQGDMLTVTIPGLDTFRAELTDMQGRTVACAAADADGTATLRTGAVSRGVYVVSAAGRSRKIIVE